MIIPAKNMKANFHEGIKFSTGRNKGVPAHTIVSMLIEIVRNLIALLNKEYTWYFPNIYIHICLIPEQCEPDEKVSNEEHFKIHSKCAN